MDISIVITAHNYASYISECVESSLNQNLTHLDYEIIIIDDGSTDQTPDVLKGLRHPRLKKYRINNCGIEAASNYGFQRASGKYIVRLDADDKFAPNYLKRIAEEVSEQFDFFYSDYYVIAANSDVTDAISLPNFQREEIFCRGDFLATGTLYRAELLKKLGGYDTQIRNSGLENYELILRLVGSGSIGRHISEPLFYYRRHSLNISETKRGQIIQNGKALFSRMSLGEFTTNEFHPYKLNFK